MKKTVQIAIIIFLLAASFVLGSRVGVEAYVYSDAKFKAALTSMYLQMIEQGKIDGLRHSLESDLDIQLHLHVQGENNLSMYLFPEIYLGSENKATAESALVRAATYRKNHQPDYPSKAAIESATEEEKQYYREHSEAISKVVNQYAR